MSDTRAGRIEVDSVLLGKDFDGTVLFQIRLVVILNVVIKREDELPRIRDLLRADGLELAHHGRRVVMGHDVKRPDGDEIACAQWTIGPVSEMSLSNLFDNGLRHEPSFGAPRSRERRLAKRAPISGSSKLYFASVACRASWRILICGHQPPSTPSGR